MHFALDSRLGIELPDLSIPFEAHSRDEQEQALVTWHRISARIPDQIMRFEHVIEDLLHKVHEEEDWDQIAEYFHQISDYASRIHELNTWRRVDQALHQPAVAHPEPVSAREHRDREK